MDKKTRKRKKQHIVPPLLEIIEPLVVKSLSDRPLSSLSSLVPIDIVPSTKLSNSRCSNGTRKYSQIGPGCFTRDEISAHKKLTKLAKKSKKSKIKPASLVKLVIESPKSSVKSSKSSVKSLKSSVKSSKSSVKTKKHVQKIRLKTPPVLDIMDQSSIRYNEKFIELLGKLRDIMMKHGEPFRARAYQNAQETIIIYPDDITSPAQLKGLPGIGSTIMEKLNEYVETGTLKLLEREKNNPINILADIYGVGPKKAKDLVSAGITNLDDLNIRKNELLNDVQKVGLHYHSQIMERIPRSEIVEFDKLFTTIFAEVSTNSNDKFEIVGSYRRGTATSGDIDVIITGNNSKIYTNFVEKLVNTGVIVAILSRGKVKTLVIAKLPGKSIARRVDFLYAPHDEFAFAILYFTGSKFFNTVMRQQAVNMGYTMNEHGLNTFVGKKKGSKVEGNFKTEKDIFDFLHLQYKTPVERRDGRAVLLKTGESPLENLPAPADNGTVDNVSVDNMEEIIVKPKPKNKTIRKKKAVPIQPEQIVVVEEVNPVVAEAVTVVAKSSPKSAASSDLDAHKTIEMFKTHGISVLEKLNEKELSNILIFANKMYYNEQPVMNDNQFDIVKEFIDKRFPSNAAVHEIGAEVERNKVSLPFEMASMDKIKPDTAALGTWMKKYPGPYVISCKLDGVSGLYTTTGDIPKLYTRGNGKVGQDISHLIPHLRLPKTKNIAIRGEFIIAKQVFEQKYKMKFANPRNMVAGIINHKTISENINDLHFVAYEVIMPELKPSAQMEFLKTVNVEYVRNRITDSISNDLLSTLLVEWRRDYLYEIDGIIVSNDELYSRTSGNPAHSFAFKMVLSDQMAEVKVVDVLWSPSKHGYLKPRVQYEPINLGGAELQFATGINASFIYKNNIGIGAIIKIIRSGDVIPKILAVEVPADAPKMPDVPYKWNDTHVDIMLENITDDSTVQLKNVTGFFRGIGVESLSIGNVAVLINNGYSTIESIIKMSEQDFLNISRFGVKMGPKLYNGIHRALDNASIVTIMSASNIFGRGFAQTRLGLILNILPDILTSNDSLVEKASQVAKIDKIGIKTAELFVKKIAEFKDFLQQCGLEHKLHQPIQHISFDTSHELFGKNIVLTGTRDSDIIDIINSVGAKQCVKASKNTFIIVAKDKESKSGTMEDAIKYNIPVMNVEEFISEYGNK